MLILSKRFAQQEFAEILARYRIKYASDSDRELWDGYARKHPGASLFHLFGWRDVISRTYGHATYYLMLMSCDETTDAARPRTMGRNGSAEIVVGVLPLVHLKHALFGNSLVSLPFVDGGGILADSNEAEERLLREAVRLGRKTGANQIELRHDKALESCNAPGFSCDVRSQEPLPVATRTDKVRMLLDLPESSQLLMKSFKSKLRSQILKPSKEGLTSKTGGAELLRDFYRVFLINMSDLGSPVHSITLMRRVLAEFPEDSRIVAVYKGPEPVAAALVVGFDKVLSNPWASSLREYASLSPNMLLYRSMLEYACDHGYRAFDFGRSTKGEGTYRFKEQWGAAPVPLFWHYISIDGKLPKTNNAGKGRFEAMSRYWKRLPLNVTRFIGPRIRKHIGL